MQQIKLNRAALTRLHQFCEANATASISIRQDVLGELVGFTSPPYIVAGPDPELCAVVTLEDIQVLYEQAKVSEQDHFLLDALPAGDPRLQTIPTPGVRIAQPLDESTKQDRLNKSAERQMLETFLSTAMEDKNFSGERMRQAMADVVVEAQTRRDS